MKGLKRFLSFTALLFSLLFSFCIALFILLVCLRNTAKVDVDLFFMQYDQVPIEIVFLASFFVGAAFGLMLTFMLVYRFSGKRKKVQSS